MIEKVKGWKRGRREMVEERVRIIGRCLAWIMWRFLGWVLTHIPRCVKPNHITTLRIVLAAPIAVLFRGGYIFSSGTVLALAVFSDAVDGALARVRGEKSKLGEVLDPLADKVLIITLLLVGRSHFLAEFVDLTIALEIALVVGRIIKWVLGKSGGANGWGKAKMHFQSAAVIGLVVGAGWTLAAANLYLGVAVVLAAMSFIGHLRGTSA